MISLQLVKLEAYGFKSFADKLEIEFGKGVTAIVGPNGSGKSNITDAIKWVLGEQNIRNLRGAKAEDIIFAGGVGRKALGVAEVSLLFDNTNRKLPIDFNEVKVTRRLFRSGDSEYYINKAACRLKDIHELFADSGLGRDAMSVISQNKVDQILNSKPEERRLIFEEVAGITKFRNRKKESLKKLEETQQNLTRVYDIIAEIESQLENLELNAQKTQQYNEIQTDYKKYQVALLADSYLKYQKILVEAEQKISEGKSTNIDIETNINLQEVAQERLTIELFELETNVQSLLQELQTVSAKIDTAKSQQALFQERINQNCSNIERIAQENVECKQKEIDLQEKIDEIITYHSEDFADFDKTNYLLEHQEGEIVMLQENISSTEIELLNINEKIQKHTYNLLNSKNSLSLLEADLKNKIESNEKEQANLKMQLSQKEILVNEIEQDKTNFELLQKELNTLTEKLKELETLHQKYSTENNLLKNNLSKNNNLLSSHNSKLNVLSHMQHSYEGFGKGVKEVLKANQSWSHGICGVVAEVIEVKKEYITAIEIALGSSLQNVITLEENTAKSAINYLREEKLGRVTFLPIPNIKQNIKQDEKILQETGIIDFADKVVSCDEQYKNIIRFLLGRTIIADNIDSAMKLARKMNYNIRIVTLNGEILTPGGALSGGGKYNQENSFLNREAEISKLEDEIQQLQQLILQQTKAEQLVQKNIAKIEENSTLVQEQAKTKTVELAERKVYLDNKAQALLRLKQEIVAVTESNLPNEQAIKKLQDNLTQLKAEIDILENNDQDVEEKAKTVNELLLKQKQELAKLNILYNENKLFRQALEAKLNRHNELKEIYQNSMLELVTKSKQNCDIIKQLEEHNFTLEGQINLCQQEGDSAITQKVDLEQKKSLLQATKLELLNKQQQFEKNIKLLRKKLNESQNNLHELELLKTKYEYELNRCAEELTEIHQLKLTEVDACVLAIPTSEVKYKLRQLEKNIAELGLINHNAIEEFKTAKERYVFLQEQSNDLIKAKDYLSSVIAEIDANMAKQFAEAVEKVNIYFAETFKRLFGGGEAKIKLTDKENLLETGIEIIVQPPDKKMQNLVLLSGGERALTVIALLFSFLKYKPAPFSVVDEIDAPLDEANLDRFSNFLQEYARNTQFIVVTHRKGTMQAADVMHGVTVEDSGVSKVISVKIDDF